MFRSPADCVGSLLISLRWGCAPLETDVSPFLEIVDSDFPGAVKPPFVAPRKLCSKASRREKMVV